MALVLSKSIERYNITMIVDQFRCQYRLKIRIVKEPDA
jgi:hypothetical protein